MSKSITDKTTLDMVEEGKNNFVSSRFEDAANLFESTVRNLEKNNYHIDAVYFSYAKIVSLNKAEKWEQRRMSKYRVVFLIKKKKTNILPEW